MKKEVKVMLTICKGIFSRSEQGIVCDNQSISNEKAGVLI